MESSSSSSAKVEDPCYFLEDALRALLKCLGVETKPPQEDPPSGSQDDPPSATTITTTTTTTTTTSTDVEADPPSTTETQANSVSPPLSRSHFKNLALRTDRDRETDEGLLN